MATCLLTQPNFSRTRALGQAFRESGISSNNIFLRQNFGMRTIAMSRLHSMNPLKSWI